MDFRPVLDAVHDQLYPNPKMFSSKKECKQLFIDLTSVLVSQEAKEYFVNKKNGLEIITNTQLLYPTNDGDAVLVDGDGGDCQYRTVFALWLLSYVPEYVQIIGGKDSKNKLFPHHCSDAKAIKTLVKILRFEKKTRVVRVVLMTLRNLVDKGFNNEMNDQGAIDVLNTLKSNKWPDEEIPEDIEFLRIALQKDIKELSTWSVYRTDVLSGEISWKNPCHHDETFWRQNVHRFEENDSQVLKELVKILREGLMALDGGRAVDGVDPGIACAVSCHDIGWFVKCHPRGKRLITKDTPDAKTLIFRAVECTTTEDVHKEALLALQILMVADMS